jgi:hypothetical protein
MCCDRPQDWQGYVIDAYAIAFLESDLLYVDGGTLVVILVVKERVIRLLPKACRCQQYQEKGKGLYTVRRPRH